MVEQQYTDAFGPNGRKIDLEFEDNILPLMSENLIPLTGNSPNEATLSDGASTQAKLKELEDEIYELAALYNIGMSLNASLSLREAIKALYVESNRLIDTTNFAVIINDESTETLNFALIVDQGARLKPFSIKRSKSRELVSLTFYERTSYLVPDLHKSPHQLELSRLRPHQPIRSWLSVPMRNPALKHEPPVGVLALWSDEVNKLTKREQWLLAAIGTQAAVAIRNARLFEASQQRAMELALINDVSRTLTSTLNLEDVLTQIMEHVETILHVEMGLLLLTDRASGDLVFQIASGQADAIQPFRIPKGQGIAGQVALTGKPIWQAKADHYIGIKARNVLCVPLVSQNQVIGVLEVINKRQGHFTEQDANLLRSIASFATIAIENARLYDHVLEEKARVIEAEEEARKALARDLHDGPTQVVAGMIMRLNYCQKLLAQDPVAQDTSKLKQELATVVDEANRVMHQMRTTLFELRPLILETEGLEAAIRVACEHWQRELEAQQTELVLHIETSTPGGRISRLDTNVEAAIFAIVQEMVNNAIKHAEASQIVIHFKETSGSLYITVADDGTGFKVKEVMENYGQRGSLGMINIRDRTQLIGGGLSIDSTIGQGTQIRLYVPKEEGERLRRRGGTGRLSIPQ